MPMMEVQEDKANINVQDTVLIRPTDIRRSFIHPLSNLDQLNAYFPIYFPILYFFRSGAESLSAATELVASLKQSLAKTLNIYPVLAGRLIKGKGGRLEIDVNGEGVEFWVAKSEARLDKWQDLRFCDFTQQLVPKKPFMFDEKLLIGAPLACVMVTTFSCGGVAISFNFIHAVGDMQAMSEFVEDWAHIHREASTPAISSCLDTAALLRPRDPPIIDAPIEPLLQMFGEDTESERGHEETENLATNGNTKPTTVVMGDAILRIADVKVAEVVHEVEKGPYSYGRCSSFEAVAGLLWVSITRARSLPPDSYTHFTLPVNMRQRWHPPLPPRFFGNVALPASVVACNSELLDRHISYAARLVHECIVATDAEYGKAALDWLELQLQQRGKITLRGSNMTHGCGLHASVMLGNPLYELDFGWGATVQVSLPLPCSPEFDGALIVMPSPKGGKGRDLIVRLKIEHMKKLLADSLFANYLSGEEQRVKEVPCMIYN